MTKHPMTLKDLAMEMLSPEPNESNYKNQLCIKPPISFPDVYIEELELKLLLYNKLSAPDKCHVAKFNIHFGGSAAQYFNSNHLILSSNIYEIYTKQSGHNEDIPKCILCKFKLSAGKDYFPVNIVLGRGWLIPEDVQNILPADYFSIEAINRLFTPEDNPSYCINLLDFTYFKKLSIRSYKKDSLKKQTGDGSAKINQDLKNKPYFMPDILIHSQNKILKINNLSTWLVEDHNLDDDPKFWFFTHRIGETLNPPSIKTERFFLHGYDIKFALYALNGTSIETILFSSSIAFLTQNKNNPDIQNILSSIKLQFNEKKLEALLKEDSQERVKFLSQYLEKDISESESINAKILQEHINVYEYLLNNPSHAHQRDEIHRYIAYFRSRLSWPKKLIFWLTGDYFNIVTPLLCALWLYALRMGILQSVPYFKETIPFYKIFDLNLNTAKFWETVLVTFCKSIPNIIRWAMEAGIGYCIYAAGAGIKKHFGMGNSKDFFTSHSA